jgi:inorganic pyrophosphatase
MPIHQLLLVGLFAFPWILQAQDSTVTMLVEIPAGTNLKYEVNKTTDSLEVEIIDGEPRRVKFLPYPGNYGFIRQTLMDKSRGGDGDALDILLIASSLPSGTTLQVIPIGILSLLDHGEKDDKIIAVPADITLRIIPCVDYTCLENDFPGIITVLQTWFTQYKGPGKVELVSWKSEKEAYEAIRYWTIH